MSEREQTEKVKDLQYSFSGFLWRRLDEIHLHWSEGDFTNALWRAMELVIFLPTVIKKELEENVEEIKDLMARGFNIEGSNFQSTMVLRGKTSQQIAQICLSKFMNKMVSLLDSRGYLERGSWTPIMLQDFKKLESEGAGIEG